MISHTSLLFHCVQLWNVSHAFLYFPYCHFKKLPPIPWDKLRNTLDICLSSKYCSPHPKKHWVDFFTVVGGHLTQQISCLWKVGILKNIMHILVSFSFKKMLTIILCFIPQYPFGIWGKNLKIKNSPYALCSPKPPTWRFTLAGPDSTTVA